MRSHFPGVLGQLQLYKWGWTSGTVQHPVCGFPEGQHTPSFRRAKVRLIVEEVSVACHSTGGHVAGTIRMSSACPGLISQTRRTQNIQVQVRGRDRHGQERWCQTTSVKGHLQGFSCSQGQICSRLIDHHNVERNLYVQGLSHSQSHICNWRNSQVGHCLFHICD